MASQLAVLVMCPSGCGEPAPQTARETSDPSMQLLLYSDLGTTFDAHLIQLVPAIFEIFVYKSSFPCLTEDTDREKTKP